MSKSKGRFTKAILGVLSIAGMGLSIYFTYSYVDFLTLIIFGTKAFLLGSGICVIITGKKKIVTGTKSDWSGTYSVYEFIEDPLEKWFIVGFGIVAVVLSLFLIIGWLSLTIMFTFLVGYFFVYSGAANELMGSRQFVEFLSIGIIIIALLCGGYVGLMWLSPQIVPHLLP
ncbi:MAG: hypothetical protein GF309_13480 [Candidatus Lokiarchaeota archaeon]|nr:hypothetical protein [Candidatus Lokiarchaeota archaeon]